MTRPVFRGTCLLLFGLVASASASRADTVVYARHLALSPDASTLAFCWAGDLWAVSRDGGAARRLTVHPATESYPVWSRDGQQLAFASNRHGAPNVFVMSADGENVRRLTFGDQAEIPSDFSADGQCVLFHSRQAGEIQWMPRMYRVPVAGGQAFRLWNAQGSDAHVSPDGKQIAFARGGERWWRWGYRGSADWDLWVRDVAGGAFRQLTTFDGADMLPTWDRDGRGLYFLSDRDATQTHNVWYQPLDGEARPVTRLTGERVRDYSVSADGRLLAYTQWDKLYVMTLPDGAPREVVVTAGGDSTTVTTDLETFTSGAEEAEASPDGKEVALVVRGEIFVIKTEEGKLTRRATESAARDRYVTWSPDGKAVFFVSDRDGQEDIYRATSAEQPAKALSDSMKFKLERVTDHPEMELFPQLSPDGKKLAFARGLGHLIVRDLKSGEEQTLLEAFEWPVFNWSPDSQWIAYHVEDAEYNSDVWIVPADGSKPRVNISQHPDNDVNPQWSADGQILAFSSPRAGFDSDLYFTFLSPALDEKSTIDLNAYFEKAAENAKKRKPPADCVASGKIRLAGEAPQSAPSSAPASAPASAPSPAEPAGPSLEERLRAALKEFLAQPAAKPEGEKPEDKEKKEEVAEKYEWDLPTAFRRLRRVTSLPDDQSNFALAPDGASLVFASGHAGSPAVYSIKWNGEDRKEIIGGGASGLRWSLDGKTLYYVAGGVPRSCTGSGGDKKTYAFRAKMAIEFAQEAAQKFDDAARMLGARFYHPTLKGLDWSKLTTQYKEFALKLHTWDEFNEMFNLLQGRLNGSHQGIFGPSSGRASERIGYLGCQFDGSFAGPGLRIASVLPKSPADRAESRLFVGDVLLRVNGRAVGPDASIEQALVDSIGDPVIVEFTPGDARVAHETPASASQPAPSAPTTAASQPAPRELILRPITYGEFADLSYQAWVDANRKYVEEKSHGRVGYAHIEGMGAAEFYLFERDLYAAANGKDGLIIDVRNNGGGWTADWVMAVLNVRRHAYTIGRGGTTGYPQDRLIFYAWTKPATMMCNQFSYSNAEIISHAFKNLKRGPLVGMTTWGAVISTGAYGLIDGAMIRMPFRGWYTLPEGVDMELNGARPDVMVEYHPDDEELGREPQLDAAVQATLDQLPAAAPASASAPAAP